MLHHEQAAYHLNESSLGARGPSDLRRHLPDGKGKVVQ
jgi:hypothetical protein